MRRRRRPFGRVFEAGGNGDRKKFKPSSNEAGQKILLTTISPIVLRYTRRVEIENFFAPEFATALALYLAGQAGKAITGSQQKADDAMRRYWDKKDCGETLFEKRVSPHPFRKNFNQF